METGSKVDDFTLSGIDATGGNRVSLSDFGGNNFVLYFYPRDNTPGCTQEACDFRDNINRLTQKAIVIGISTDSVESHKKFQQKHSLNFILLSDRSIKC
jgi:peroxiredoxin Q/BCP